MSLTHLHANLHAKRSGQSGFTLVELAIVLVIIGLIVGGVLVGQDLIKAAEIRATISQLEKYNAAANTFREKHGGLPGDITTARAAQFGLLPARVAAQGQGDGNGLIQGNGGAADLIGEPYMFWSDLSIAQLIQENLVAPALITTQGTTANIPPTRMRESAFFHVYAAGGRNFYLVGTPTLAAGVPTLAAGTGISPIQAFAIDQKLDNAIPNSGSIISVENIPANTSPTAPSATVCRSAAATYNTNIVNAVQDAPLCHIAARASF